MLVLSVCYCYALGSHARVPLGIVSAISCNETILLVSVYIRVSTHSCIYCYLLSYRMPEYPVTPYTVCGPLIRISLDVRVSHFMLLLTGIP